MARNSRLNSRVGQRDLDLYKSPVLRLVSGRGQVNDTQSNGTDTVATSRVRYTIPSAAVAVRLLYANFIMTSGVAEAANPYSLTVKAAVEDTALVSGRAAGTGMVPVYFNGRRTNTLDASGIMVTDPVYINVPDNWAVFVRTTVTAASGDKWPTNMITSSSGSARTDGSGVGEGVMTSDQCDSGSFTASSSFAFAPVGLVAYPTSETHAHATIVAGDSIAKGFHIINAVGSYLVQAAFNAGLPVMRLALGGDAFASIKSQVNFWKRMQLAQYARNLISNYGINDVRAGYSLATIKADALACWAMWAKFGLQVHQATLLPNPGASTDGYITASNQSIVDANIEAVRAGFNSWLRDTSSSGAIAQSGGTLKSIIDGAALCEVNSSNVLTLNGGRMKPLAASAVVSGTATGFTTTTVTDTSKTRTTNQDQSLALTIVSATTGSGQISRIASNNTTPAWTIDAITLPTGTVTYSVTNSPLWDHLHPSEALHASLTSQLDLSYLKKA